MRVKSTAHLIMKMTSEVRLTVMTFEIWNKILFSPNQKSELVKKPPVANDLSANSIYTFMTASQSTIPQVKE